MSILTSAAIEGFRNYAKRTVGYGRYNASGTWHKAGVLDISTTSAGVVEIEIKIDASVVGSNATITRVQLYDTSGALWADKAESLSLNSVAEGFTYVFQLAIKEVEATS